MQFMEKRFELENNYQLWGDSTDSESYQLLLNGEKADIMMADPPYCLLTRRRKKGDLRDPKRAKINHEAVTRFEKVKDYRHFTEAWMKKAGECLKDDAVMIIWTNFLGREPIEKVALDMGYNYWGDFKWAKLTKEGSGNELLARLYEVAMIFGKGEKTRPEVDDRYIPWSYVGNYDDNKEAENWGSHPNHKPFDLLEILIRSYSRPGDLILDPFNGSGSTPAATLRLKRRVAGIELREEWAKITRKRFQHEINS